MIGVPNDLRTKQDFLNAVESVIATGEDKAILIARLEGVKATVTMMELKESGRSKRADQQLQEDYASVPDPNCEMRRLGFSEEEIDGLIGRLK